MATQRQTARAWQALLGQFEATQKPTLAGATGYVPLNPFGAAGYLAVLAYPTKPDQRARFMRAVESWLAKGARKRGKLSLSDAKVGHWPVGARNRDVERGILAGFHTIHRNRLPFVVELFFHAYRVSHNGREPMQRVKEAVAAHWVRQGNKNTINQPSEASRKWSETKPVLHLARALYEKALPLCVDTEGLDAATLFYRWAEWLEPALLNAEQLRHAWTSNTNKQRFSNLRIAGTNSTVVDIDPAWSFTDADLVRLLPKPGYR